jgi:hypothetical protein
MHSIQPLVNASPIHKAILITALFAGIGAGIYQLPVQTCGLLHYEVVQTDARGLEFCKDEAGVFLDLDRLQFPIKMEAHWAQGTLSVRVQRKSGEAFLPYEIALSHQEKIHLFIVNEACQEYHHLHPEGDERSGEWTTAFTPYTQGPFRVFAQFVHKKTKRTLTASTMLAPLPSTALGVASGPSILPEGTQITPNFSKQLAAGSTQSLKFTIHHPHRGPLEPFMAAYAHGAIFKPEHNGLAHLHPLPISKTQASESAIEFLFRPEEPGLYVFWLQIQLKGEIYSVPFSIEVIS